MDASGNEGLSGDYTFTTSADTTPPVISGITAVSITTSGATIQWLTDEPSTSQVEYGFTSAYGFLSPKDMTLVTSHAVTLSGLNPNTVYYFRVKSEDSSSNEAMSGGLHVCDA